MKFIVRKTVTFAVDTASEHARIKRAFRSDPVTQKKLNEFMDLIEARNWEKALTELAGTWWQGRDDKMECPRMEFIGMIKHTSPYIDHWLTYADLAEDMYAHPEVYTID